MIFWKTTRPYLCKTFILATLFSIIFIHSPVASKDTKLPIEIVNKVFLEESPSRELVEFIGGWQTVKNKEWSYLAFKNIKEELMEVGPAFRNLTYGIVAQYKSKYLWAFGFLSEEGAKQWGILVISEDYGKSWKIVNLKEVFERSARFDNWDFFIGDIISVKFFTPDHGVMKVITEEKGKQIVLETKDGGFGWEIQKK